MASGRAGRTRGPPASRHELDRAFQEYPLAWASRRIRQRVGGLAMTARGSSRLAPLRGWSTGSPRSSPPRSKAFEKPRVDRAVVPHSDEAENIDSALPGGQLNAVNALPTRDHRFIISRNPGMHSTRARYVGSGEGAAHKGGLHGLTGLVGGASRTAALAIRYAGTSSGTRLSGDASRSALA
jgi:hypothetical protein